MNNGQKQYFREIKRLLPCSAKWKKRCMTELKESVYAFLERKPGATREDLCCEFGTPDSIAESFLERVSPEALSRKLSVRRKVILGVVGVAAVAAVVIAIVCLSRMELLQDYRDGYMVETYSYTYPDASLPPVPIEKH